MSLLPAPLILFTNTQALSGLEHMHFIHTIDHVLQSSPFIHLSYLSPCICHSRLAISNYFLFYNSILSIPTLYPVLFLPEHLLYTFPLPYILLQLAEVCAFRLSLEILYACFSSPSSQVSLDISALCSHGVGLIPLLHSSAAYGHRSEMNKIFPVLITVLIPEVVLSKNLKQESLAQKRRKCEG